MALSQITWKDVQLLPDDGHRHEAIEGVQPDLVFVSNERRPPEALLRS